GVIRASVTLDHSVGETKSVAPPLEIKLPVPLEMKREDNALPSATQVKLQQQSEERFSSPLATPIGTNNDDMEEDEEDEDDWDAFHTVKESDHDESIFSALEISTDNCHQYSSSENHNSINNANAEHSEVATEILSDCSGDGGNREKILSDLAVEEVKELSAKVGVQRRASTETGHNEDAEGSINVAGDDEQQKESSDNKVDTDLVSDTLPHVGLSDTETEEEAEHNMDQEQH
ncbi:hypothetical protein Godav_017200, partial [Gossypium davidsonii]|nr:hypothetical protein [Gossypium davidsonii]